MPSQSSSVLDGFQTLVVADANGTDLAYEEAAVKERTSY